MRFIERSSEIFYVNDLPLTLTEADLTTLIANAETNSRQQARLCTHTDENSNLHEMIMCYSNNVYVRPHKQENKIVSYHIMQGHVYVCLFNEDGSLKQAIEMGEYGSGLPFYFRAPSSLYRSMLVLSKKLLFHEVTQGPYIKQETLFAPWSPEECQKEKVNIYTTELKNKIDHMLNHEKVCLGV